MKKNIDKNNKINIFKLLKSIRDVIIILLIIIIFVNLCLWDTSSNRVSIFNKVGIAVVVSDSMKPVLNINDLIVIKKVDNYCVGDIIVYRSNNELVVHRIVSINKGEVVTKGDANDYEDNAIKLDNVYGKVDFKIPYIGSIVSFFKTRYGIFLVLALVIIMFIYSCRAELKIMAK